MMTGDAMFDRIVVFGASTSAGSVDPEGGGFAGRLRTWLSEHHPTARLHNLGIGGNTTRDFLARAERDIAPLRPELILYAPGFNDMPRQPDANPGRRTTLAEYRSNQGRLMRLIARLARRVVFITPHTFDAQRTGVAAETQDAYNAAAIAEARSGGVEVLDLRPLLGGQVVAAYMHADNIHLNSVGHAWLFGVVRDRVVALAQGGLSS